ncbi:MAG: redox-sensing transcriptional repressor Rex [Lachnospiraceae bacterium]|nr:redox-sensing transcriptional repressor Rex [Lachnospiraceae bacterium]
MTSAAIPQVVIKRLPRYMRFLSELKEQGVDRISSQELSDRMHVTASQIRQDLNHFGGFGQQGYGYNVPNLITEIGKILGLDKPHNLIVIGAGNLGRALAGYSSFEDRGLYIRALFDAVPENTVSDVRGLPVFGMDVLPDYLKQHGIDIAVLTIPKENVRKVASQLYELGIRGFWNFAHIDLALPEDAVVENVHLSESLMQLTYYMKH